MKRIFMIAVLAAALAALVVGTAMAAGPVTPPAQGFGPCIGLYTPGAGTTAPGAGMGGMMRRGAPDWAGESEEVAALLGMTAEEFQAERLAGKSLAEIAASKKISEDALTDAILDAKQTDLAALVADGKLAQKQADLMLDRMEEMVKTMVERTGARPAFQRGHGMRGQGQRGMGMRFSDSSL